MQGFALQAMKLRRVETLTASLGGGEGFADDIERSVDSARLHQRLGQQAEKVRLEILGAQATCGRDGVAHPGDSLLGLSSLRQGPPSRDVRPGQELDEPAGVGERSSQFGMFRRLLPGASQLVQTGRVEERVSLAVGMTQPLRQRDRTVIQRMA